jgi:transcription elongation factor
MLGRGDELVVIVGEQCGRPNVLTRFQESEALHEQSVVEPWRKVTLGRRGGDLARGVVGAGVASPASSVRGHQPARFLRASADFSAKRPK